MAIFGGVTYLFDVGYGVGKAGLDRLTADEANGCVDAVYAMERVN
ncbi:MAG: hypothetical protein QGH58_09165 [Arenicellales bacterium]|jgi:hypothetical protein|nr:hypothetical protein [Arenicellales bacterium]MDP6550960.1 hypothetical protein [Arenicellales bacterium]MDP6792062.1 hypothetical protein [Arenicellales bacterium]MDP6919895.1 hypothetical protein [Arenicellales bacterium]|tara:strand:- start:320 stop:454 length:135 start_codon:yes stop_codon:yes gene_type:complete